MTVIELLNHEIFSLPKKFDKGTTFVSYLEKFYKKYLETVSLIQTGSLADRVKPEIGRLSTHCDKLIKSLNEHNSGNTQKSFSLFEEAIQLIEPTLFPEKKGGVTRVIGLEDPFYRARVSKTNITRRSEMFHRDFSEREYASSERFSIPGLPCLYLSNSIYVCWEEMNRPKIGDFFVSRFQKENHDLKILDISNNPNNLKFSIVHGPVDNIIQEFNNLRLLNLIIKWPLIASCSVSVLKEDAPFKPEYIFPQFLLQWSIQKRDIDGIKYFSVKSNPYNSDDYSHFINYVFPPKSIQETGYSEHLKNSFKLTEPISWEQLMLSDPGLHYLHKDEPPYKVMTDNFQLEIIKGYKIAYVHTAFGRIEQLLHKTEIDWIEN